MVKNVVQKVMAVIMAVWAAWSLGTLAKELGDAGALAQALDKAVTETRQELAALENSQNDILDLAKAQGYIFRGDMVFFDGG